MQVELKFKKTQGNSLQKDFSITVTRVSPLNVIRSQRSSLVCTVCVCVYVCVCVCVCVCVSQKFREKIHMTLCLCMID